MALRPLGAARFRRSGELTMSRAARVAKWAAGALLAGVGGLLVAGVVAARRAPDTLRLSRSSNEVDGLEVAYHQRGAGPDVLLIHGGMGTAEDWEPVLDALSAKHRVTALDRPGFGGSEVAGDIPALAGNAKQVAGLIRALKLERPVVVGHSHGGGVALQLVRDAPELVGALVLIAPSTYAHRFGPSAHDHLLAIPLFGEGIGATVGALLGPSMMEAILKEALGPDLEKVDEDFVSFRIRAWSNGRSLATQARQNVAGNLDRAALEATFANVTHRAVVVWCDGDPWEHHYSIQSARLARELANAREVALKGCGHYVQHGQPAAVVAAIESVVSAAGP